MIPYIPVVLQISLFIVFNNLPLSISFSVAVTVLILFRYLDSTNIYVVDSLSSNTHDFIPYFFSCWYHFQPPIFMCCSPATTSVWFVIIDNVAIVGAVNFSIVT